MPTYYSPINGCSSTLDFFLTKNVNLIQPTVLNELSSDRLPILTKTTNNRIINNDNCKLDYSKTDWQLCKKEINENWIITNKLNSGDEVDGTMLKLTNNMQEASRVATPKWRYEESGLNIDDQIEKLIKLRNEVRKCSQKNNNCEECKTIMNKLTNNIRYKLQGQKNDQISKYMERLEVENGSLWNVVKMSRLNGAKRKRNE